jgi:hypothetical protein
MPHYNDEDEEGDLPRGEIVNEGVVLLIKAWSEREQIALFMDQLHDPEMCGEALVALRRYVERIVHRPRIM